MPKKDVTITLNVREPGILFELGQGAVDQQCFLTDTNLGSTPSGKVEDFESGVFTGKKVTWDGETTLRGFSVAITSIVYENKDNDVNFFDSGTLNGSGGKNSKVKDKEVADDDNLNGKTDIYTINFQVYAGNTPSVELHIDPKLKGNN